MSTLEGKQMKVGGSVLFKVNGTYLSGFIFIYHLVSQLSMGSKWICRR